MKSLGIDFGERRVGVAVSDAQGRFALPLATLVRANDEQILRELEALARSEAVERVVVGEPRKLDGSVGTAALRVSGFAARLEERLSLPVQLVNESLTSREAEARLREAGVDPKKHPNRVDQIAAQIILQEALDREDHGGG